jgi:hypothetical protein
MNTLKVSVSTWEILPRNSQDIFMAIKRPRIRSYLKQFLPKISLIVKMQELENFFEGVEAALSEGKGNEGYF